MSTKTETIRVRISPGIRVWQVVLVAAFFASLVLALGLSWTSTPTGVENTLDTRDFTAYMCTGHIPNPACELKAAQGYGNTAHVPPGGPEAYGE